MLDWIMFGWVALIGGLMGALIREWFYMTRASRIRNKVWKQRKYK